MSLRRFCGWEPAQVTIPEHDADGRLIRSVTRTEPEWDDGQRLWMLALNQFEAGLCRKCGNDLHESTDVAFTWVADAPTECMACTSLAKAERRYSEAYQKDPNANTPPEAWIYTVRKVPRPPVRRRKTPRGSG